MTDWTQPEEAEGPHCTGGHDWESGDGFGVIIGVSRCRKCRILSRAEYFKHKPALPPTEETKP